jgi:hypothetical protein
VVTDGMSATDPATSPGVTGEECPSAASFETVGSDGFSALFGVGSSDPHDSFGAASQATTTAYAAAPSTQSNCQSPDPPSSAVDLASTSAFAVHIKTYTHARPGIIKTWQLQFSGHSAKQF